ncbi:MAG: SURF1 family protein [Methyloligellaceae bacterium]
MTRLSRAGLLWPTAFAVAGCLVLIALGTWQVQRLHWKQSLIDRIEQRATARPMSLAAVLTAWTASQDVEYMRVRLAGRFSHELERHIYTVVKGQVGWRIVTPLETAGGRILFVDRGFVPDALKDPKTRAPGQVQGEIALTGLARAPGRQAPFVPDNDAARNMWYWRDLDGMAKSAVEPGRRARVVPFFVEAEAGVVPGGWPRGGVTRLELSNRHLEYAITWYGLAVALLVVYGFFVRSRLAGK